MTPEEQYDEDARDPDVVLMSTPFVDTPEALYRMDRACREDEARRRQMTADQRAFERLIDARIERWAIGGL